MSRVSQVFYVNKTVVSLLLENNHILTQLKDEIPSSNTLIVTEIRVAGSVASLFTLSLLDSCGSGKSRPLRITFGDPLLETKNCNKPYISRSSTWNSCFINVVSHKDPLPSIFITNQTSSYMPFGTFLLASDAGSTSSENPDLILELLVAIGSTQDFKPQGFQSVEYGHVVESLYRKVICKELSAHDENISLSDSLLASIKLQLLALELTPLIQLPEYQDNSILTRMKDLEEKFITLRKTSFDPSRKLNVLKKDMAQLEWYKKKTKNEGVGYYDSFRNMYSQWDHDIIGFHKNLTRCWEKMVEEADMEPQKEGAQFRSRWLYAGTNYRRMVEPLIISQYYRDKGQDYVNKKRYKALKNYEVSPEIFLPKSSYMSWWKEYKAIKGSSYDSTLASFMGNTRNYKQYALGTFDFLSMYNDCPIKCVIQHL
ncbi:PREDICTED: LOW QUALITY PROTEIN: senescence-associated carboxylesterase 101-like [Lupinus angustifolius]|uniref:LOW QUALITY PROTEIN: senescence-associated carboxylesterase 101-like n=1 Tax=Lupinus angustifolius TaxID=3871 RepID=UPI00092F1B20|nr:PREDICTED: LOW QUALITY PROTEIN: senescence-associated carboxylesterase 101-like [Lupinus angustifolius]